MNCTVDVLAREVQKAQTEYLDTMDELWKKVCAGELSHEEYWEIAWSGEPIQKCAARLKELEHWHTNWINKWEMK